MIQRFSHTRHLYKADNATVYAQLMIATLGSQYASTISPFKRAKNGRGEINAPKAHFSGAAHWDREVKVQMDFILNGNWNGQTNINLHTFPEKHRPSFHYIQR